MERRETTTVEEIRNDMTAVMQEELGALLRIWRSSGDDH